jgi:tripartite-type tricarboxylate transporter receptor subunit TctC
VSLVPTETGGNAPLVLDMHPSIPTRSVKEFIAFAKARPGKITMGSSGTGTTNESTPEEFARFLRDDMAQWTKVIKDANIKPD